MLNWHAVLATLKWSTMAREDTESWEEHWKHQRRKYCSITLATSTFVNLKVKKRKRFHNHFWKNWLGVSSFKKQNERTVQFVLFLSKLGSSSWRWRYWFSILTGRTSTPCREPLGALPVLRSAFPPMEAHNALRWGSHRPLAPSLEHQHSSPWRKRS